MSSTPHSDAVLKKPIRTTLWAGTFVVVLVMVMGSAGLSFTGAGGARGLVEGMAEGLVLWVVLAVHQTIRTLFTRTPEADSPELASESVEREVVRTAAEGAFPDAVSLFLLVAVLSAAMPTGITLRALPATGLALVLLDFAVRARAAWALATAG